MAEIYRDRDDYTHNELTLSHFSSREIRVSRRICHFKFDIINHKLQYVVLVSANKMLQQRETDFIIFRTAFPSTVRRFIAP